ncbi:alpha/beta fold hydrolase [Alteromonas sp. BL110]|uniref:haloalkane dehalogenase n=1 Tax=Alteromonas sp. BL110 TaxID=1714845 RepID=UPI000E49A44F|nr:haloalkane dehalogenase [Alteromonas sp. BL110]AXT40614.1 alpha/beta fold hydrolase [Alteromonas sp. BL110]RKM79850.1 alpha/beta fold hydrolase [Alteromonas sp. BL110]
MQVRKTPESAFDNINDFPYPPKFAEVTDTISSEIAMAYYQCGPQDGHTILLMHGEPTWAYLYRKMMPLLADAGFNVIAPDLIGFGRSDKPVRKEDYTYARHVIWTKDWFTQVVKGPVTLFCQDWGGLIGLRLVADMPERFSGVMVSNTGLPTGDHTPSDTFIKWRRFSQDVPVFPTSSIIQNAATTELNQATLAAYDAPFPDESYKAGARMFPLLVPTISDNAEAQANRDAWEKLKHYKKPFVTAFGDSDPITKGGDKIFQKLVPGCKGMPHTVVKNGGHFIQEDKGEELANLLIQFIKQTQRK